MHNLRIVAAVMICVLALALSPMSAGATPADPGQPTGAGLLATDEAGCTEITYPRAGLVSKVRPLVPARFELVPFIEGDTSRVTLFLSEISCRNVTTATPQQRSKQHDVASIIISANTATIDGQPSDGVYVLFYATENRLQHRQFNDLGWPTELLDQRSDIDALTTPGGLTQATGVFAGSGWDHSITFASVVKPGEPETGLGIYYRDTATQHLQQCFDSTVVTLFGMVTGDLTTTPLATVTAARPVFAGFTGTPSNGTFLYTGGWQSTLTDHSCPPPPAPHDPRMGPPMTRTTTP
jgi:hypothetical protein